MYQLPNDILNIIVSFCDIYSLKLLSQTNKEFFNHELIKKKLTNNPINKIQLMIENKDGIGIGGDSLNIAHRENPFYWKRKEYPSPWGFRWKLTYVWWLDIITTINLYPGFYEISGILWNIYETLIGEIRISNEYEYIILNKKFIPIENLEAFPNYRDRFYEINRINDYDDGEMIEITNNSNSLPPLDNFLTRKYKYEMGTIEVKYPSKVFIGLNNTCCSYHKDNIIFECFRIKKIG